MPPPPPRSVPTSTRTTRSTLLFEGRNYHVGDIVMLHKDEVDTLRQLSLEHQLPVKMMAPLSDMSAAYKYMSATGDIRSSGTHFIEFACFM